MQTRHRHDAAAIRARPAGWVRASDRGDRAARRVIRGSAPWRRQPDGRRRVARRVSAPEPWERAPAGGAGPAR